MADDTHDSDSHPWIPLLQQAADLWLDVHGPPVTRSSVANEFLWDAEGAYWERWVHRAPKVEIEDAPPRSGFHLYRLWGEADRLLYVGVSTALRSRLAAHRRRWGDLIVRVTWEAFDDAASMLAAERAAIADELPALNVAHVG